ncbi:MAG TPA: cation diffusion facilitator family transporter [Rhodothermales bacterium]|nr:cation diffusion facilitator family transporter [Rhodothermales bacterium]
MKPVQTIRLSVILSIVVLAMKYVAYRLTGSVSLYSDALESVVNVVAAVVALVAVRLASMPPDINHPYGHTKAEYFSAVVEGALILFAAAEIVRSAWLRMFEPVPLTDLDVGLGISLLATALNAALAVLLVRSGRLQRSPALVADGRHLLTDVSTTVGVLVGIGLAGITGWWVLDPILAIVVALNILRVGYRLVRESVGGLMDESPSDAEMEEIQKTITTHMAGAIEAHALRARHAGRSSFIEFHLVVSEDVSVGTSHAICDRIEAALHEHVPGSIVTIHVEPENKAKYQGAVSRLGT